MAVQPKILCCRRNYQSTKRLQSNSCSQIPPGVIWYKKLLLKADAFGTILLWFSLSRDSQKSAPVKIKHLAAKSSCIWVSGLSVFGVLKGICTVVSFYTLIWSWIQSILLVFKSLFSYTVQGSVLNSDCNKTCYFKEYFLIRYLHSFLVENSTKNLFL